MTVHNILPFLFCESVMALFSPLSSFSSLPPSAEVCSSFSDQYSTPSSTLSPNFFFICHGCREKYTGVNFTKLDELDCMVIIKAYYVTWMDGLIELLQGSTFRKKNPRGQLVPTVSFQQKYFSEKCEKLVSSVNNLVALATLASGLNVQLCVNNIFKKCLRKEKNVTQMKYMLRLCCTTH